MKLAAPGRYIVPVQQIVMCDMGKCWVRFRKLEDVPLEVIGEAIKRVPAKKYIAMYE